MIRAKMDKFLAMTGLAYALLIIGCFLPLASFFGESISYMDGGDGPKDGVLIIGMLVLSLPLVLGARYRWLIIPAVLSFIIVFIDFMDFQTNELGELFDLNWPAWIALFAGSILLAATAVMHFIERRGSRRAGVAATA